MQEGLAQQLCIYTNELQLRGTRVKLEEENIVVFADVYAKPGREVDLRNILNTAVEKNHGNAAAILYRLHEDIANPGHLVFYEIWHDPAAIDVYQSSPSFTAMLEQAMPATASVNMFRMRLIAE